MSVSIVQFSIEPCKSISKKTPVHSIPASPKREEELLKAVPQSPEDEMLLVISKFSPDIFVRLANMPVQKNSVMMAADHISNFFMQLTSIVIYEKNEEKTNGFKDFQKQSLKHFEAYQHLLILKSCLDL